MPGIFTPSPSHAHATTRTSYFEAAPRLSFQSETTGRQVIDPDVHETRKRSRGGSTAQHFVANAWHENVLDQSRFGDSKSPPPLAHDRYQLADGGMDLSHPFGRQVGDYDDYFQLQRQRGQWSVPPTPHMGAKRLPGDQMELTPSDNKSWSLLSLVGGVAGKLFQFCAVPFRGFQAGGGQKYTVDGQEEIAARLGLHEDPCPHNLARPVQQITPGTFPQDDYGVRSIDSLDQECQERPRMTKRLRTADNWVVVGDNGEIESRPSTPRLSERRLPDQSRSPSQIPRPVSRTSAVTPSLKRPSLIPVSRRSTIERRSFYGSAKATPTHVRQKSFSRMSYGSPAVLEEKKEKSKKPSSPLPKESQRLINKVRREELEEDERMRRMSSQMSAMLREAKEALGSKFEIEDEYNDDPGYSNDRGLQQSDYFPRFS
ncbi:hypothetical protein FB567DRAFT_454413 [Paraphoma chrysanthemicola]|uniref:Uncharacterized protein n=1 Tax=Paraphoma chrysanthemicola TaxID=798071 RepID=A0A8K0VSV5_9PLEO|nr:hypothetical protein FB567DRAFT_454413 [Paraphoma chrysanthemicola]